MTEIQIYCRRPSQGESSALIGLGVKYVAWDVRPEDGVRLRESRDLVDLVRGMGGISSVLVHERKVARLATVARMLMPDFLLLSSDRNDKDLAGLAAEIAPSRLMVSVPVGVGVAATEIPSLDLATEYCSYAGMLTVDTCPDSSMRHSFGCTGMISNWDICAEIVSSARIPVVLAGGLSPLNVGDAIRRVRPAVVDACTSLELPDRSKNLSACRAFVEAVAAVS